MNRETEAILKTKGDFNGLFEVQLSNEWGLGDLGEIICKVCYYSGRLKSPNKVHIFFEKYESLIAFRVSNDYKELWGFLFKIGFSFPNLSENDFKTLEKYYCIPKYYDLLEDILFDQNLLGRKLNKFDATVRNTHNSSFSDELLKAVFKAAMYNIDVEDEEVFYYDKSKNKVVKKTYDGNDVIQNVHYVIRFLYDFNEFSNSIDEVLGDKIRKAYYEQHTKDILHNASYKDILIIGFSPYYFKLFESFVDNNGINFNLPLDAIDKLKKHIALKWLQKVNKV